MATRTRKPAAPTAAPVAPATPVYSEEMLAVARESLKDHKNRARVAHACQMSEFKVNGIQRRIREVMACTDTKKACEKLLAHVQTLASPAAEPTEMVAAATPAPKAIDTSLPSWAQTIHSLEAKLAEVTQERNGQKQLATSYSLQLENVTRRAQKAEGELANLRTNYRDLNSLQTKLEQRLTDTTGQRENAVRLAARKEAELTELRRILMPAMGIEPENWPAYSLSDAAQGVVDALAAKIQQATELHVEVRQWKSATETKDGLLAEMTASLNSNSADLEAARKVAQAEQTAHAKTSDAYETLKRRLKAWQAAVVLAALAASLLGAGLSYWGFRK